MALLQKQTMLEKDMSLKNKRFFVLCFLLIFFCTKTSFGNVIDKQLLVNYLNSLKSFSASFIQNYNYELSEGKIYINETRLRIEYVIPSKILIIMDEDKAMYYNYELEEDEFFDPKDTDAWYVYDIFRSSDFFENGNIYLDKKQIILEKLVTNTESEARITIYFEDNPLILRKIHIDLSNNFFEISLQNHSFTETFDNKFFKLINPEYFKD